MERLDRLDSLALLDMSFNVLDAGEANVLDFDGMLEELFSEDDEGFAVPSDSSGAVPMVTGGVGAEADGIALTSAGFAPTFNALLPPVTTGMDYRPSFTSGVLTQQPHAFPSSVPMLPAGSSPEIASFTSETSSGGAASSGQDVLPKATAVTAAGAAAGGTGRRTSAAGGRARRGSAGVGSGGEEGGDDQTTATGKKRRTRNAQQMELNRIAQQKYRERKKAEHSELQTAVDQLAAQLAAFKVLELRASQLEATNTALTATVSEQSATIASLQQQVATQTEDLESARAVAAHNQALISRQQAMILDQHAKLELQNQVISSLKEQLREKIDAAMDSVDQGVICEKLMIAVKAAIYGAGNMQELQSQLDRLPNELVTEICKNVFMVVKEAYPELKAKCHALAARGAFSVPCNCN